MRRSERSKSGLFLLELMIAIGLFALSAAVCLQLFAHAQLTVEQASDLNQGVMEARSVAACYQATHGDLDAVATLLSGLVTGNMITVYYDGDWQVTDQEDAYMLTLTQDGFHATIVVEKPGMDAPIYTLETRISEGSGL